MLAAGSVPGVAGGCQRCYHTRRMSGRIVAVVAGAVLLAALGATLLVSRARGPARDGGGLRVVTTTPVLYSLTAQVLGGDGTITNLVPPGASPENYALQPLDAEALSRADVVVRNGLNFEQFLEGALAAHIQRGITVITASAGIATAGDPPDPHVWVDPLRAVRIVENIADGLASGDPAHAASYRARAAASAERLRSLDAEFESQLAPLSEKRFIAFHPAWGYFAERYGLEQLAVIEQVPGREPTAQELGEIIALVRAAGMRALMSEPQFSPKIVEVLARDLGLAVQEVNPEGGELSAEGYERFMRANVAAFIRALSGT